MDAAGEGGGREAVLVRTCAGTPGGEENIAEVFVAFVYAIELGVPEALGAFGDDPIGDDMAERPEDRGRKEVSQDVPCSHRGGTLAVKDATLGRDYGDGAKTPLVIGDLGAHRALDGVRGVRVAIAVDDIDSAVRLWGSSGVVGDHTVSCHRDGELDHNGLVETVDIDLLTIGSVGNGPNGRSH